MKKARQLTQETLLKKLKDVNKSIITHSYRFFKYDRSIKQEANKLSNAVMTCIRELKSSTNLIQLTNEELLVKNCATKNFDMAISRQLENDWHPLKPQTKHLVSDLPTLRTFFPYLIH